MFRFVTPGILANDSELYFCKFSLSANGPDGIVSNASFLYLIEPLKGFGFLPFNTCCLAKNPTPAGVNKNLAVLVNELTDAPTNSFGERPKTAPLTLSTIPPAVSKNFRMVLFFENCSNPPKPNLLSTLLITKGWSNENLVFFLIPNSSVLLRALP